MPAAIETAVYANTPAWHQLGTVLDTNGDQGITVEQALKESGIDWEVQKAPTFCPSLALGKLLEPSDTASAYQKFQQLQASGRPLTWNDLIWVEGRFNTQRQTDGRPLGNVGSTWEPVQNAEGFQIITDLLQQAGGQAWIESAGSLEDGARVWVLAHVDTNLFIAGEQYFSYILFTNGHNGRASVTAALTDIRVVCANTLDWALSDAKKDDRVVRVRHTTKAADRMAQAAHIFGLRNKRAEELAQQGEWLVNTSMDDGEFNNFLETLMPVDEEQEDKPAGTMIRERQDKVREIYMDAPNLEPIRGTVWGALHAVTEYSDHHRNFASEETQLKAQFGITSNALKQQAHDLAVAFAGAS